jgi:hypothetical protein
VARLWITGPLSRLAKLNGDKSDQLGLNMPPCLKDRQR